MSKIEITAYDSDTEPGRINRLHHVKGYLTAMNLASKVKSLHDHKGLLTITWLDKPRPSNQDRAFMAWSSVGEREIEHKVDNSDC